MAVFTAVGSALVTDQELMDKQADGAFDDFVEELKTNPSKARIPFSNGELTAENRKTDYKESDGTRTPFMPIGPKQPLTIEIRHVYTGDNPRNVLREFFIGDQGTAPLIVTSAIKPSEKTDEIP
jgi:hypothetical protein